jgi:outer membrane lipoprotein carrier protein
MLNNLRTAFCLLVVLGLPALAQATALEQFKSFVSATRTARGEFTQRLVKAEADRGTARISNPSTGSFQFARPGKFIWIYSKPYEQLLQADGDKLYIFDKDLNQVTIKTLAAMIWKKISRSLKVVHATASNGCRQSLKPKTPILKKSASA